MLLRDPDLAEAPLVGLSESYQPGLTDWHAHRRIQLMYATEGSLTVLTEAGSWVLPPSRALLLPGGLRHVLKLRRRAELRTLYLDAETDWITTPAAPQVIAVPALLRELILAAVEAPWDHSIESRSGRLARVLCDELVMLEQEPVHLPELQDSRARKLAAIFYAKPAERRSLMELAAEAGASLRTLERCWKAETGLAIREWVQQLRLMFALEAIAAGARIGDAAFEVGFENPSSFIALFRQHFGTTPARYFGERG
ncbi:MAG: helix-turn-helix domain-containing protein [Methylobacterium sp.]|nr:helix-turn-helix domain-containing protein [Methylobacterium sp.]MCA3655066.1 helix-turn-helix domain-containing protein [Methylobacterium sp.]MCA3659247.1 helix-turn-helix domain-containing protein [Methylobacterium sp.]MCA3662138.1 helix-turn-helix domain-containing protein [Methylobacterium sp.]MCA3663367.1 helix-turn-helix domain-containing protein [Methylobacterium sp.]